MLTAVQNMIEAGTRFEKIAQMMERIEKGNKVKYDESVTMGNINSAFIDLFQSIKILSEIRWDSFGRAMMNMIHMSVKNSFETYQRMRKDKDAKFTDYQPLLSSLAQALEPIKDDNQFARIGTYNFNAKEHLDEWVNNEYEIPQSSLQAMLNHLHISRDFNYLDINCQSFKALLSVKDKFPRAQLYSVTELGEDEVILRPEDRAKINRLIRGGLKQLKASNNVFDVVFIVPQFSFMVTDSTAERISRPKEIHYLSKGFDYLRKYGLMIYVTPIELISSRVATYIAKNLRDISIYHDENVLGKDVVAIMGMKSDAFDRVLDPKTYNLLRNLTVQPELSNQQKILEYELPSTLLKVERFRGGILDDVEMNQLFKESGAVKEFWEAQHVTKISDHSVHPLLPFNLGQLGLVLTSGCLDGVVDEGNGCSHAIKGRVVKVTDTNRKLNNEGDKVQVQKKTANQVEISMFMPDGEYKCLL